MERYIAVPTSFVTANRMPEEVETLAKTYSLSIRIDDSVEEIQIVSKPKIKTISYMETYTQGSIWSVNIHDEFTDMSGECFLKVNDKTFFPKIKEKHIIKFRIRHDGDSKKLFTIYVDGKEYLSDTIFER
jgi:hypothetical protein